MKKKVLLVEDNPENRYLATFLLQGSRFAITACESGTQALRALQVERFDLIVLDLQLPDIDGIEIARHVRHILGLDTPIAAVSAFALSSDGQRLRVAGFNAHFVKPIDPERFADQMAGLLAAA